jgi:hypothetical protein
MSFENNFPATTAAARDRVQNAISSARECTNDALVRGEQCVRERPRTALLSAFAVGLAVGVIVAGAISRPPPRRPTLAESLGDSKDRLADLFGTVAANLRDPVERTISSVSDRASTLGDSLSEVLGKVRPDKLRWW